MPAALGALEFNHDEVRVVVEAEQIHAAFAVLPVAELLGDHHHAGRDDLDGGGRLAASDLLHLDGRGGAGLGSDNGGEEGTEEDGEGEEGAHGDAYSLGTER